MSWNYRIIRSAHDGSVGIHEVYYDDGIPTGWSENPSSPYGETLNELKKEFEMMARALSMPVLREVAFIGGIRLEEEGM